MTLCLRSALNLLDCSYRCSHTLDSFYIWFETFLKLLTYELKIIVVRLKIEHGINNFTPKTGTLSIFQVLTFFKNCNKNNLVLGYLSDDLIGIHIRRSQNQCAMDSTILRQKFKRSVKSKVYVPVDYS